MSRCFPFPPPGYERKARTDDVDLLKKEKNREKKHKKEKKDKEKREGKEKREKDRSDGKHREKRDKKEKDSEKKKRKERDKDKDKDKNGTADEKGLAGQSEILSGPKFDQKEKEKEKDRNKISGENRTSDQTLGPSGGKHFQSRHLVDNPTNSRLVQELHKRVRDEERGTRNQLVEKFSSANRKKDEGTVRLVAKASGNWAEGKENSDDKESDNTKMDAQGIKGETRFGGSDLVQSIPGIGQPRVEGMPRPSGKDVEKKVEKKEKTNDKDKDREKKSQGKEKRRDKEKKKEEKAKEKSEHKNMQQNKSKEGKSSETTSIFNIKGEHKNLELDKSKVDKKDEFVGTCNIKAAHVSKDSEKNHPAEGNLKKRKDIETNGYLHASDIKLNKLPRPYASSHSSTENGRILESCQTSVPNLKTDNKEQRINGVIEAQSLSISPANPLPTSAQAEQKQIPDVPPRPPHPDSKYLSKVLSVPKLEEWSVFDEQEWLFCSSDSKSKKAKLGSLGVNETPQVWAEALQIGSADVCALPYVIPY